MMNKKIIFSFLVIIIFFLAGFFLINHFTPTQPPPTVGGGAESGGGKIQHVNIAEQEIKVDLALTAAEQEQGLWAGRVWPKTQGCCLFFLIPAIINFG